MLTELNRADASMAAHAQGTIGTVGIAAFASSVIHVVGPALTALCSGTPSHRERPGGRGGASMSLLLDGAIDVAVAVGYLARDVVLAASQQASFTPRISHVSDDFHAEAALASVPFGRVAHIISRRSTAAGPAGVEWWGTRTRPPHRDVALDGWCAPTPTHRAAHESTESL